MKKIIGLLALTFFVSCTDLTEKMYNDLDKNNYYTSPAEYESVFLNQYRELSKIYGYNLFYLQELTTDEACLPQKGRDGYDGGIYQTLHWHTWTSQHSIVTEAWKNLYSCVGFCNQIIDDVSSSTILPKETKELYIAETRAMRAYFYYLLMDLYGNVPITTKVSELNPKTRKRNEVFAFIETELSQVKDLLLTKKSATLSYGRFTKEAVMALLSRLYLNAEVYTGKERLQDCINISNELLTVSFLQLDDSWDTPFIWDNEKSKENIFVIPQNELLANDLSVMFYRNMHWSMTTPKFDWQGTGGWNAVCTIGDFIRKYDIENDKRCKYDPNNGKYGQFIWGPQSDEDGNPILGTNEYAGQQLDFVLDLPDMINCKENAGARNIKYKPIDGAKGLENDIVVFRLSEIYFNLAEAQLRKNGIVEDVALEGINKIRQRAGVTGYTIEDLTLEEIYDERGREFCYELLRRTDMIRFNTFTEPMWDKEYEDKEYIKLFPIPYLVKNMNPNLDQNEGYN